MVIDAEVKHVGSRNLAKGSDRRARSWTSSWSRASIALAMDVYMLCGNTKDRDNTAMGLEAGQFERATLYNNARA